MYIHTCPHRQAHAPTHPHTQLTELWREERKLLLTLEHSFSSQDLQNMANTFVRKMVPTPSDVVLTEPKGLCSDQIVLRTGVG